MTKKFILEGLECASCAAKIERAVSKIDGVRDVTVNFMTQKMLIEGDEDKMESIMEAAAKAVKKYEPDTVMKKA